MSEGDLDIKLYGDASHVIKEQAKLIKQQEQAFEAYKKLATESKKAGKEAEKAAKEAEKANAAAAKELDRFARATKEINRTPLEKYADEMLRLNRALKAGKIDQETFNRAVAKTRAEFQQAGEAGKQAFGGGALANLANYATRLGGIATAAMAAKAALSAQREEAEAMGQMQSEQAPTLGMLAQVADTPEDLKRLQDEAKKTFAEGGAKTLGEAAALQFSLESGGVGNLRGDFSRMQASGLVPNAALMAEAAIKLTAGMGAAETGDFRSVISKAFGAGKLGLGSAEELLSAAASTSSQASRLGLKDEEVLAAISTASAVEGPQEARTQIEALLKGIEVEGIGSGLLQGGKSLQEQVAAIAALEKSGVDIREILGGRQEAVKGFGILSSAQGQQAMAANLENIERSVQEDWFGQKVAMAEATPMNAAAILARKKGAKKQLGAEETGIYENLADAVDDDIAAKTREKYGGGWLGDLAAGGHRAFAPMWRWGLGNRGFISAYGGEAGEDTQAAIKSIEASMKLEQAAANLEAATSSPNFTNAARANQAAAGGAVEAR